MGNAKILVVDDEPLNIMLYKEMLKYSGYLLYEAMDGKSAIEAAQRIQPDLVIMDWNMPVMSGMDALALMKADNECKEIPVIMITGIMTSSENLETAFESGAADFLRKPFDRTELRARVRSTLLYVESMRELREKYQFIDNSNRFTRSLIESVPHPLFWYSLDGIFLGCNSRFEVLSGCNEAELVGKSVYRSFDFPHASLHLSKDMELIENRGEQSYELNIGDEGQILIFSKNLFQNSQGEPSGILCIISDVTEMKRLHQESLEIKKKELVSSALRLIQVHEINNNLITELGLLNKHTNKQGAEIIRKIIHDYNAHSGEGIWKDFEARFEQVYESFYKKLFEKFPDLTPGERKLCALLRLNLSSKDIAAITFQNPQSVDMARYRLRKKLSMSNEENLVDFLARIDT
jgi:PAS domain S-box-containing protein